MVMSKSSGRSMNRSASSGLILFWDCRGLSGGWYGSTLRQEAVIWLILLEWAV
jgi:hypothetical protein